MNVRNERQAYMALVNQLETKEQKTKRIMAMDKSFAFRLAALNASDSNKGHTWS